MSLLSVAVLLSPVLWLATHMATAQATQNADETIRLYLERATGELAGRVEIDVGQVDSRVPLAPCARIEPALPPYPRLPGRVLLQVRCLEGANWIAQLPVQIRLFIPAMVAAQPIAANQAISRGDLILQEVEVTRDGGSPVRTFEQIEGRAATRALAAGIPLRQEWLRPLPVILAGDMVRVSLNGRGFSLSTDAQALTQASDGQTVRLKTESGRVLTAIARPGRVAEIAGY